MHCLFTERHMSLLCHLRNLRKNPKVLEYDYYQHYNEDDDYDSETSHGISFLAVEYRVITVLLPSSGQFQRQ
jgi:hypothetical protein